MDDTRDVAQYREEDIDQKVGIATTLEKDTDWWQKDGENDFANVTVATILVTTCSHCAADPRSRYAALRLKWLRPRQTWRSSRSGLNHNKDHIPSSESHVLGGVLY